MGNALAQLWTGMQTGFMAFDILMQAILHLCTWSERTAKSFAEEAEEDRQAKQAERRLAMGITPDADSVVTKAKKPKATTQEE